MTDQLPAKSGASGTRTETVAADRESPAENRQFLTFKLNGESFAAPILSVKEIIEFGQVTAVPMMPDCIRGVINLRGNVVSVVDLSARFGQSRMKIGKRSCVVIIETAQDGEKHVMGMLVEGVDEVVEIVGADIDPPPNFGAQIRTDFIEGLGKHKGQFVIILNLKRVLSLEELGDIVGDPVGVRDSAASHFVRTAGGVGAGDTPPRT